MNQENVVKASLQHLCKGCFLKENNAGATVGDGGSDSASTAVSALPRSIRNTKSSFRLGCCLSSAPPGDEAESRTPVEMFLPLAPRTAASFARRARQWNANRLLSAGMFIGFEPQPKVPGRSTGLWLFRETGTGTAGGDGLEVGRELETEMEGR